MAEPMGENRRPTLPDPKQSFVSLSFERLLQRHNGQPLPSKLRVTCFRGAVDIALIVATDNPVYFRHSRR